VRSTEHKAARYVVFYTVHYLSLLSSNIILRTLYSNSSSSRSFLPQCVWDSFHAHIKQFPFIFCLKIISISL